MTRFLHRYCPLMLGAFMLFSQALPAVEIDRIVALVNDDIITQTELNTRVNEIKRQLQRRNIQVPADALLEKRVLERLIVNRIQLQLAANNGIRVDDETLNNNLSKIAAQNGLSLSRFHDVLQNEGMDFSQFREDIREQIIIRRLLQRYVDSRITVTEQEIDNFLANQKTQGRMDEEYHLGHILIALPEAATPARIATAREKARRVLKELRNGADFSRTAISMSDGQQALKGGDLGWRKQEELPTLFSAVVPPMKSGALSDVIRSPSGFHIIKLLDKRSAQRHIVTETRARHILVKTDELTTDAEAQRLLTQIRARLGKGEDFAALALSYSDDKASASSGGDLGWVRPGEMIPAFEKTMDGLQPGAISKPFKTQFGWHIVQVLERRKHDDTEEFTRSKVRELIYKRKSDEDHMNWLRRIRSEAYVEYRLK